MREIKFFPENSNVPVQAFFCKTDIIRFNQWSLNWAKLHLFQKNIRKWNYHFAGVNASTNNQIYAHPFVQRKSISGNGEGKSHKKMIRKLGVCLSPSCSIWFECMRFLDTFCSFGQTHSFVSVCLVVGVILLLERHLQIYIFVYHLMDILFTSDEDARRIIPRIPPRA